MKCTNAYFNGWGTCASLMEKMNGAAIQEKGNTWTDITVITAASWRTGIADDDSSVRNILALPILSFENSTDDVEITTTQLGKKSITGKPIPSALIYLDASLCDYKQLHALAGTQYEFIPHFQDGSRWMTRKSDGTLKGFRCKLDLKAGLPPEDKSQSFPVYLFFDSYTEFEDVVLINPDFNFADVMDYSPAALNIRETTAYAAGDVVVKVTKRGTGEGMAGLVAGDFEVMDSNAEPTVVVTAAVDNGLGQYTLTIQKDNDGTPADLVAGEFAVLQAHDDDATYVTYLSHAVKITVA